MPDDRYDPSSGIDDSDLEDDGTLDASDTLDGDPGDDPLDQGIVPPDRWSAGEGFGTTLAEERAGEGVNCSRARRAWMKLSMGLRMGALASATSPTGGTGGRLTG